jgi:hypothetical protein
MINSKTILALVFLMAGALLTTTAVTTMVPVVYADDDHDDHDKDNHDKRHDGKDGDVNKAKAEDQSVVALASCDNNELSGSALLSCFPSVAFSHSNTFP